MEFFAAKRSLPNFTQTGRAYFVIISFVALEDWEKEFFASNLAEHEIEFCSRIDHVDAQTEIVCLFIDQKIGESFLEEHPALKLLATRSHSIEHIDTTACQTRGIAICRAPAYGDVTVAEHTFALILALSRRLRVIMQMPKQGSFSYELTRGFDLAGKTIGIVGMGRIGHAVTRLARGFSMEVLAYDPEPCAKIAEEPDFTYCSLEEVLNRSHVISLHANLTATTYHILNAEAINKCIRGVLIINTARGALIDTTALREALESGQVGGAGLDVLEDERILRDSASHIISDNIIRHLRTDDVASEERDADRLREVQELMLGDALLARSNVVFTPHVAFNSIESVERLSEVTLKNIESFIRGAPLNLIAQP
ncbi:MAG: D-isomer specific 2-hydroxyacid dehydrogenase NAD-binding [Chthoniobacteraceae bacterium]|nr:D-isomer specific 2-hydroxyacid dehydrogenase NAD-binding [Chthoniobacteraceae bacterium]